MQGFPVPTNNTAKALDDIRTRGMALLSGQLTDRQLESARKATYLAMEDDKTKGRRADRFGLDYGEGNIRVWNILNRHEVFRELVQLPAVLTLLREVIGWPALLGNISANIALPGGKGGMLHADQLFMPQPWPDEPQGINFAFVLDEFTAHNGATEVVPDSHRLKENADQAAAADAIPITAPAGTVIVMESRLWHRTGSNRSGQPRAALFGWYTRPIYRTQENWFLSLDRQVIEEASDELLVLLGYKTEGLGLVYGASPR